MRDRPARWFQDYQDGISFRGRSLFAIAARLAEIGYRIGYRVSRIALPGRRRVFRPRAAVIGVGSLLVGGSGKTSLVDYIASRLLQGGRRVTILTRGYGRRTNARVIIDSTKTYHYPVDMVGDEPLMLARRLPGVAIVVDADRAGAAQESEQRSAPEVFVLDDAAQYRKIAYDCMIFTITPGDLKPPFRLLPAGRWREPASRLREADAVGIVGECSETDRESCEQAIRRLGFSGPIVHFVYAIGAWRNLDGTPLGETLPAEGCQAGAFCGLARPGAFFGWLGARGIALTGTWRFADHCRYSSADIEYLRREAARAGVDLLITTQKDAVKLARFADPGMRIIYPDVRLVPVRGAEAFDHLMESAVERRIHN